MGECVEKLAHECGSNRGLQVFQAEDGSFNGYCFSCGVTVDDPYKDKPPPVFNPKTAEQKHQEVMAIAKDYGSVALPHRALKQYALEYFGVRVSVNEGDGVTPQGVFFPFGKERKLSSYKFRDLHNKKKMYTMGEFKGSDMFGWGRALRSGERILYITEGEFDAIALYQILKDSQANTQYADNNPAVVSVTSGSGSALACRRPHRHRQCHYH